MDNAERDIFSIIGKLPKYSKLLVKLYRSREIRKRYKVLLSMSLAYSLSPIELIPGIIPVAGQLDNLLVMLRCLEKVLKTAEPEIREKYLIETDVTMEEIKEDIDITVRTLRAIGRGTVKVVSNTARFVGYSALYGFRKLRKLNGKDPF